METSGRRRRAREGASLPCAASLLALAASAVACAAPTRARAAPPTPAPRASALYAAPSGRPAAEPQDLADEPPPEAWTLAAIERRIALANPTLEEARAHLAAARAELGAARAERWPALSLGLAWTSTDNPSRAFAQLLDQERLTLGPGFDATPGTVSNWREEVRIDWALYAPGRGERSRAAGAETEAARHAALAIEQRLANAGVQTWFALRAAHGLVRIAEESEEAVAARLAETRTREREGAALRADVLRLEVRLAAAREELARAVLDVRRAEAALARLMGLPQGAPLALADQGDVPVGAHLPEDLAGLQELALRERPDLRAAREDVLGSGLRSEAARAERWPTVDLFAAYYLDGELFSPTSDLGSYAAGVGLRLPLDLRTAQRIRAAASREHAARAALAALELDVAREVREAQAELEAARATLLLAESSEEAAQEAFRIVAAAQDAGAASVTDVLEVESARRGARERAVVARTGVSMALARLCAATGGVR